MNKDTGLKIPLGNKMCKWVLKAVLGLGMMVLTQHFGGKLECQGVDREGGDNNDREL